MTPEWIRSSRLCLTADQIQENLPSVLRHCTRKDKRMSETCNAILPRAVLCCLSSYSTNHSSARSGEADDHHHRERTQMANSAQFSEKAKEEHLPHKDRHPEMRLKFRLERTKLGERLTLSILHM